MLAKRNCLTELEINSKSKQIQEIFTASSFFEQANILGVYLSHGSEVRTQKIIEAGFRNMKTIAVPRVMDSKSMRFHEIDEYRMNSLRIGKFGILEPNGTEIEVSKSMDLLIVPGIAFDLHGYRLGHGMGYYDNFLRNNGQVTVIGLAFDIQIIKTQFLPHSMYDVKIGNLVTESGFQSFELD
jgi:5-formyltetrahydrofolate cyclo-ligase